MQFSSVFCLVGVLQLVRSVRIELRYNKPECGPYGFRCLNDKMFEICAEFKRADDYFFTGEDKLYPPIGSKASCPEGRECDKDNPRYCTSERDERYTPYQRKHKKCNEQTTPPPPPAAASEDDDEEAEEEDDDSAQAQCHTEPPCNKAPAIVFDESKTAHSAAAHAHTPSHHSTSQAQGAEAPTYQIHSQGGKAPCGKHEHKTFSEVFEDSGTQGAHDSKEVPCSSCDNAQPEESPPVVFYETGQGSQNGSCADQTCEDDSCNQDSCSEDTCSDSTTTEASEVPCSSCSYRCIRAGNYPDPKDCKKYFFCDINNKGDGFVASHKSCRCGEVFNSALRECIPIENLHADTKRSSDYAGFKCVKCGDFPDTEDCHKYYHCEKSKCSHNTCGKKFEMSHLCCPEGTKFIPHLKRCGCISPDECDDKKREVGEEEKEEKRSAAEPPYASPLDTDVAVMSTPEPASYESSVGEYENLHADMKRSSGFQCVECGDFADPEDCHKYYHCEKNKCNHNNCGKKFEMSHLCCPEGTKFIPHLKRCGCISPDECDDKREIRNEEKRCPAEPPYAPPLDTHTAVMSTLEPAAYGSSSGEYKNLHADTKRSSDYAGFKCVKCGDFPDPEDCHKYYHCEKTQCSHNTCGKKFEMSHLCCPEGTKFIRQLKRCGCIAPDECDDKKREVGEEEKEEKRCAEAPCASPPNNCIVVMSTPGPSCGSSCDEEYEEGPQLPDGEPDQDDDQCGDGDQCDDQCGGDQGGGGGQGDQCGGQCGSAQPVVRCPSHPAIRLPKMHHFNCHGEGKFADPYNCTTFFVCHPKRAQGGGFEKLVMSCPSGEVFDQALQKCVPSHG